MTRTIYALLVGINEYKADIPSLFGCVNDVKRMDEFLRGRTRGGDFAYKPLLLTAGDHLNEQEDQPTYQRLCQAFRDHLAQAKEEDVALFYYSGHGSQEKAPPEFWHLEPDRLDETIVLYDSRTPDVYDLADKELAVLIAEVAKNKPHIVVILDACHSGSGTRNPEGTLARLAATDTRDRPLDSFLPGVVDAARTRPPAKIGAASEDAATGDWLPLPHGRHIVISACRSDQLAREKMMDDLEQHGVLSYFLVDTLQSIGSSLNYRDIFNRASALVRSQVTEQNPVIAATSTDDLLQPFLGGAIRPQPPYFSLEHQGRERGWVIRGGAIHGIVGPGPGATRGQQPETTELAILPLDRDIQVGDGLENSLGFARVKAVGGSESTVDVETADGKPLNPRTTYKTVVVSTSLPPITVALTGDDQPALEAVRTALKKSLIVVETDKVMASTLIVTARQDDHLYRLRRTGDLLPLDAAVPKGPAGAAQTVLSLEHMAQWIQLLKLDNRQTQLKPDEVTMEIYREVDGAWQKVEDLTSIRLAYDPQRDEDEVRLKLRLVNNSANRKLYCMIALLSQDFSVNVDTVFFGSGVWLEPGQDAWASQADGTPYAQFWVPDEFVARGVTEVTDVLKLIVSTDDSDATLLRQHALDMVATRGDRGVTRSAAVPRSTLDRLMRRVNTRAGGSKSKTDRLSDWRTETVTITTVRADKGVALSQQPSTVTELGVSTGVRVQGHPGLKAKARLAPLTEGSRDVGNLALPAALRNAPQIAEPFRFTGTRGGDGGESVIVLSEVENREAVTPDNPLIVQTPAPVEAGHAVLPVAVDPETGLFLPLGLSRTTATGTTITINHLPAPTADSRSLGGSIKLFFQKIVAERFGFADDPNRLALVTVNDEWSVTYDASPATLKARVQAAQRILLYVHGIIGDTHGMAASSRGLAGAPADLPRLAEAYDLILTYDYENLKTPIQITALKLKQSLEAVGLGANHGQTLHIVAHSMGSLVSRWFIEREGGNQVVQKAVFAGPPMAGSPWPKVEDLALVGLGLAINGLAALAWPPSIIPTLIGTLSTVVGGVEQVDETLDQMKVGSDFYQSLNASADPGVPYVVVAGNTEKIRPLPTQDGQAVNPVQALVTKLTSKRTRNELASLLFMNKPNDIAVSVASQVAIPEGRTPEAVVREIACDHLSYFSSEVGIKAIAEAL